MSGQEGLRREQPGPGRGLPTTSRYCCTTLLGSGPRKMYTSRIPPVDLQLRAGLGWRTTSGGSSLGAQGQILTPLPRGLQRCTNGPNPCWRGPPAGSPGAQGSHSEPSSLRDLEQDRKVLSSLRPPLYGLSPPPHIRGLTLGALKDRAGRGHGPLLISQRMYKAQSPAPFSKTCNLSGRYRESQPPQCRRGCSCIKETLAGGLEAELTRRCGRPQCPHAYPWHCYSAGRPHEPTRHPPGPGRKGEIRTGSRWAGTWKTPHFTSWTMRPL